MKYQQNLAKITGLMLMLPLLMANSAMPYPKNDKYLDYDFSYTEEPVDNQFTKYSFELKNYGKGYISTIDLYYQKDNTYISFGKEPFFGYETLFYPGGTFKFEKTIKNGDYNFSKENINVFAYLDIDADVTMSGTKDLLLDTTYQSKENNRYSIDVSISNLKQGYRYDYGVTLEYDGQTYCSMVLNNNSNNKLYLFFGPEFDASKAKIKEIIPFKYVYDSKDRVIKIVLIIILSLFLLTLLAPAIVLPIVFGIRKRRRCKQNA